MFFESIDGSKNFHNLIKLDPISFSFARTLLPDSLCSILAAFTPSLLAFPRALPRLKWLNPQTIPRDLVLPSESPVRERPMPLAALLPKPEPVALLARV